MPSKIFTVAAFAFIAATPAFAGDDEMHFAYKANELKSEAGVERLYKRINKDAKRMCKTPGRVTLDRRRADQVCAQELTNEFVNKIGDTRLHTMHNPDRAQNRFAENDQ